MQHIDSLIEGTASSPARTTSPLLERFLATTASPVPTLLRVALGGVILAHGAQKVFGWFGGYGLEGTMGFFGSVGIPAPVGALVIASDFFGSLALLLGVATRFSAAAAFAVMLGAALIVHLPNGFFMNWGGAPQGEGYELHVLAMAMAASLVISGGGRASLDAWLASKLRPGLGR
ncbi:MAG: DoxX family protein [Myxococcales bacterium]|nr:MAG: DoxX family protein [Myxococcales bacterium]